MSKERSLRMKNWKLGTKITLGITIIVIICMSQLYLTANKTMTGMMQESELNVMKNTLNAQASLLNGYVARQESILTAYSKTPCVRDFLKDVNNSEQQAIVQSYTEDYYSSLTTGKVFISVNGIRTSLLIPIQR